MCLNKLHWLLWWWWPSGEIIFETVFEQFCLPRSQGMYAPIIIFWWGTSGPPDEVFLSGREVTEHCHLQHNIPN